MFTGGEPWDLWPLISSWFQNLSKMDGKFIILRTKKESNTKRSKKSGLEYDSIRLQQGNCVRYLSFQKYDGCFQGSLEHPIHSDLLVCVQVSLLKRTCLGATSDRSRLTRVLSISMKSDLSMGLAIKLLINLLPRCTRLWASHGLTKEELYRCGNKVTDHIPPTSEVLEEKQKVSKRVADPLCRRISQCACL